MAVHGATPCLWFDTEALDAAEYYVSIFPDSRITNVSRYGEGGRRAAGEVLLVSFEMFGRPFTALNGGPEFPQTEAVSFQVSCDTQEELDRIWNALVADGGAESMCGWCKDRFGVSWQVTPANLETLMSAPGAWDALMKMQRIVISELEGAADHG